MPFLVSSYSIVKMRFTYRRNEKLQRALGDGDKGQGS